MAEVRARHGAILTELNIVGGRGIPHLYGDQELNLDPVRGFIEDVLDAPCAAERFRCPTGRTPQRLNMVGRLPPVAVKNRRIRELVRRETIADLLARDPVYKEPRLIREHAGKGCEAFLRGQ
jgi:hypothetical protein